MKMKTRKNGVPRTREERPLNRSFNSQQAREQGYSDLGYTDSDSDDELSWEDDGEYSYTVKRKPNTSWSDRYNKLLCLLAIAIFVIALLVAVIIYQHVNKEKSNICTTTACVQASSFITQKMDQTADPCQDFYKFLCGNWEKTVTIPDTRPKYTSFSVVADKNTNYIREMLESNSTTIKGMHSETVKKMKIYYNMCLNQTLIEELGTSPLEKFIEGLGSWTISGSAWNESSWKLEDVLGEIRSYGYTPLFETSIGVDDKNSTQYILMLSQPVLTLKAREEYNSTYPKHDQLYDAMLDFGATLGQYLGSDYNETRLKIDEIYQLEKKLADISLPKELLRQTAKIYHKMKIKDLQKLMGDWIDLSLFLQKFLKKDLPVDTDIIVYTPEYYEKLGDIVKGTNKSTLANYLVWSAVNLLTGYLPLKFTKASLILDKVESGVGDLDPVWQRCVDKTNAAFGFGTSALYVESHFSESSRIEVEDILQRVRSAFESNMPGVDWMDQQTRETALEKLKNIKPMIGYPDWILNATELDKYYENVTVTEGEFFKTYVDRLKESTDKVMRKLDKTPDRSEWDMKPYVVNAYYTPTYNKIVFPAGILQRPFYDPDFPLSYSFGSVGAVMGHEMTHGFDDQGRLYDKYGNLENWWTNQSTIRFKEQSQCMIDQYSQFTFQGHHVIGERTIGENIADNGGIKSGYIAFSRWEHKDDDNKLPGLNYTPEQLYFIGFGQIWCAHYTAEYAQTSILTDVHSPAPIRPNGIAVNSKAFSEAFNCPKGSPMNPEQKCEVW